MNGLSFLARYYFFRNVILRMFIIFTCPSGPAESHTVYAYQQNSTVSCLPLQFNSKGAMDGSAKGAKTMATNKSKDSTGLYRSSSILSVGAILLTVALFVRIETVVHDMKMLDSKFTLEIQQIKDALKEEKDTSQARVKENFDKLSGK